MRITIASLLVLVAICLGLFAAAPGNLNPAIVSGSKRPEKVRDQHALITVANTRSPIRHLNRSFDNVFGTYVPLGGQKIWNLLSQGIVTNNGAPGPNAAIAAQQQATDTTTYRLSPTQTGAFGNLPQPNTTLDAAPIGPCLLAFLIYGTEAFCTDIGLDPTSQGLLSARGTGQQPYFPQKQLFPLPDCRYPSNLPNGPFSIIGASKLNNCGQPFL